MEHPSKNSNVVQVSEDNPEVVNDLIRSLPKQFQKTVSIKVPNDKYPDAPLGTVVEDFDGNALYYQPYVPVMVIPYPIDKLAKKRDE